MRPDPTSPSPRLHVPAAPGQRIAVIGSGISGLSAAWLLSQRHAVTLYEAEARAGGHSHTVTVPDGRGGEVPVDTGFIVFNTDTYPNLCALFEHLGVASHATDMGFAVSADGGALEYSGDGLAGLFAQRRNLVRPRFWSMLRDLVRFYRQAPGQAAAASGESLDAFLDRLGYGRAFREDHLYPMAAAIWSTPVGEIGRYPVAAFVRFCENHHLLTLGDRPPWRTVVGGSRAYVQRLLAAIDAARPGGGAVRLGSPARVVQRDADGVTVLADDGQGPQRFAQVVIATHADQALALLQAPTAEEARLLGAFGYTRNLTLLHRDPALMPRRRAVWSAWNYLARRGGASGHAGQADHAGESAAEPALCVSYWMNRLQDLGGAPDTFVTLNPLQMPAADKVLKSQVYEHPRFDIAALQAQSQLWQLQGVQRTWFCGAYFGAGFHEDGLQAGLAVAEACGGVRRPWTVAHESGRIPFPQGHQAGLAAGVPA